MMMMSFATPSSKSDLLKGSKDIEAKYTRARMEFFLFGGGPQPILGAPKFDFILGAEHH